MLRYLLIGLLFTININAIAQRFDISNFLGHRDLSLDTMAKLSLGYTSVDSSVNKKILPLYVSYRLVNTATQQNSLLSSDIYFNLDSLGYISAFIVETESVVEIMASLRSICHIEPTTSSFGIGNSQLTSLWNWNFQNCQLTVVRSTIFQGIIIHNGNPRSYLAL